MLICSCCDSSEILNLEGLKLNLMKVMKNEGAKNYLFSNKYENIKHALNFFDRIDEFLNLEQE